MTTNPATLSPVPVRKRQNLSLPFDLTRWGIQYAKTEFNTTLSGLVEKLLGRQRLLSRKKFAEKMRRGRAA